MKFIWIISKLLDSVDSLESSREKERQRAATLYDTIKIAHDLLSGIGKLGICSLEQNLYSKQRKKMELNREALY